jgi:hypothetical protein
MRPWRRKQPRMKTLQPLEPLEPLECQQMLLLPAETAAA